MDRKTFFIFLISFGLLMLWFPLVDYLYPPVPKTGTNQVEVLTNTAPANASPPLVATSAPSFGPVSTNATQGAAPGLPPANPLEPETRLILENEQVRYHFTSHGGGIKEVDLKLFPAVIQCREKTADNRSATLNSGVPIPAMGLLGWDVLMRDPTFRLSSRGGVVRAEKQLAENVILIKEFQLESNYLLRATVRLENRSSQPLTLPPQEWVVGTAVPTEEKDGSLVGAYWSTGQKSEHVNEAWFENRTLGCFAGTPRTEHRKGASEGNAGTNLVWAAVHNRFFTMALIAQEPASEAVIRHVDGPVRTNQPASKEKFFGHQGTLVYPSLTISPGQQMQLNFYYYAGPREFHSLARLGDRLKTNLDAVMDFGGFFGWFAKALLLSMNGLHRLGIGYGLAIILITILIKLLFWPLTAASTRSMKRLQELQPQIKAIQDKYKDDPQKKNQKTMEFMKENRVSPIGGCLPILLQIPVFFGFYQMLQSAIELRGESFLWVCDMSSTDTIFVIPGLNFPVNPLPLIMGVTMLWQARLTPPSPGMDPMQQKIMKYMPLMFIVFLYNFPAGLALYWTVQNLFSIAQTKLTKTSEKKKAVSATEPAPRSKNKGGGQGV